MAEPSDLHTQNVSARDEEFWLLIIQSLDKSSCQMTHPVPADKKNNGYKIYDDNNTKHWEKKVFQMNKLFVHITSI